MTPEIRRAALRAAAKAALVVSLGCSGGGKSAAPSNQPTDPQPAAETSCAEHLDSLQVVKNREDLAADDPLRDAPEVYAAFSDRVARESPRTQQCCSEALVAGGSGAAHRFECCSAIGGIPEGAEPSACTPWGPPCPPQMS